MATRKANDDVEIVDETSEDKTGWLDREVGVFSKATAIYFETFHNLHQASYAAEKSGSSPKSFLTNTTKAHKAAWKHVLEHSEVHRENKKLAAKVLPKSSIDSVHNWVNDADG